MILLLVLGLSFANPLRAQESPSEHTAEIKQHLAQTHALLAEARGEGKKKGVSYQADYMYYYEAGDSILLQGQAVVLNKNARLEAAEMVFRRRLNQVEARAALDSSGRVVGRPVLRKGDETLRGERILYNLETEKGTILSGQIHRDKGFYAGHLIQTRSAGEFHVHQGSTSISTARASRSWSATWR